jgi:CheY-like chemotaxis protein
LAEKTILIVDDELGIVEVLEFILRDAGFIVVSALNGQEALARLHETKPHLVILDFMMPVLDGSGVIKAMRADDKLQNIPVILTSALPEQMIKEHCDGFDAFLRKPYKTERLLEEISTLLGRSAVAPLRGVVR